ncbi:MAG: DNA methyltransferase [bacterium]|nr:DNA methyltransferase [bacterium]
MPELRSHLPDAGECPHCGCTEWRPPDTRPAVVLDCFAGSGTVGLAADRLQRDSVLIEVSPAYAAMAAERIQADSPLFAEVTVT